MSKAFRVGVFVVLSMLAFVAGVFWIGSKQYVFSATYRVNADFNNVAGLSEGYEAHDSRQRSSSLLFIPTILPCVT